MNSTASPAPLAWFKSSRSAANGCCVETALTGEGMVVRDSKDPDGPVLYFAGEAWSDFVAAIKTGQLDLP